MYVMRNTGRCFNEYIYLVTEPLLDVESIKAAKGQKERSPLSVYPVKGSLVRVIIHVFKPNKIFFPISFLC